MIFISDIHDAPAALQRLVGLGEEIVILGDLVNLTDYRTGQGAVSSVMGSEFAAKTAKARALGNYGEMRALWTEHVGGSSDEIREQIRTRLTEQYRRAGEALEGGTGYVIHGNVDRPDPLVHALPGGFRYVHGEVIEQDGLRFGFVGGGVETPLRADGELSDDEMAEMLESLGPVDVLCTHVAPAHRPLRLDVVTGREERGSQPVLDYVRRHQPRLHLFGDVHQPQASRWRIGATQCHNAGYFRATGRYLRLDGSIVHIGALG